MDAKHLMRFQSRISVFKFLRGSVDAKHLMRFQSRISVFKFLRGSVDGTLNTERAWSEPIKGQRFALCWLKHGISVE